MAFELLDPLCMQFFSVAAPVSAMAFQFNITSNDVGLKATCDYFPQCEDYNELGLPKGRPVEDSGRS